MKITRRQVLSTTTAVASTSYLPTQATISNASSRSCQPYGQADLPTPTEPDDFSHEEVIAEAYGKLKLTPDRPYWAFPVCSYSDPITIEYEVRPENSTATPSILVVDGDGLDEYQTKIEPASVITGPIFYKTTIDLPLIDPFEIPTGVRWENINFWNLLNFGKRNQLWTEGSAAIDLHTVSCLNSADIGPVTDTHTIESGQYYVVFDWTDDVLQPTSEDETTVHVSLRASHPTETPVTDTVPAALKTLYNRFSAESSVLEVAVPLAEAVCSGVPNNIHDLPVSEINQTAPQAGQLIAAVNAVLTILDQELEYAPAFTRSLVNQTSALTRWGMSAVPVASSLTQFLDDACEVADAAPDVVTEDVENMLVSLGIFVADLAIAKYGLAARVARFTTGMAHKYLLGFLARVLGLETYLMLLREVYTMTLGGVKAVLGRIKEVTKEIGRQYNFLSEEEVERVQEMDEDSLLSLNVDIDWFSLNPECSV